MSMVPTAQLQRIVAQHAAHPRPSTSPTPTGMFDTMRKNTAGRMMANSKLRPLPPTGNGPHGGFHMMMEGSKTGTEKAVSTVEKREAVQTRPAAERKVSVAKPPVEKPDRSDRDQAKIRKLEQEVKKLQANLREKNTENDSLKGKVSNLESSLSKQQAENDRMAEKNRALAASNEAHKLELENLQQAVRRHEEGASESNSEAESLARQLHEATSKFASAEAAWAKQKEQLTTEAEMIRVEAARTKLELEDALRKAKDQQAAVQRKDSLLDSERREARDREANLRSEALKAKQQLAESEKKLAEWKQSVETCNSYIVNICQPSFSVVKDESLAPVTPGVNTPDGGGFVLVPLPLLLEGYGLLPNDLKKQIASDYEKTKKDGPAPDAGAFALKNDDPAMRARTPSNPSLGRSARR